VELMAHIEYINMPPSLWEGSVRLKIAPFTLELDFHACVTLGN
jgi:hypothetical protein